VNDMTQEHPINPPPELVREWATTNGTSYEDLSALCQNIATQAARWGADTELEGCCEWLSVPCPSYGRELRNARRPKLLSLKEQALVVLDDIPSIDGAHYNTIRRALEALPND
jgi:hypothetical protein